MSEIKVSYDDRSLSTKPDSTLAANISKRIGKSLKPINKGRLKEFALDVSTHGHTFCPATFRSGNRSKDNFEQQQLFALDFDNKNTDSPITFEEVKKRAEYYELPIMFAYETLSSTNQNKFRVVFLNDVSVTHRKLAEAIQIAMGTIFPEADSSCYRDISKMYYGGKKLLYYDDKIPTINMESVFRNATENIKDTYKSNHYKTKLSEFSKKTGIAIKDNGLLDVTMTDNPTEYLGANQNNDDGKNSPSPIIYANFPNIIADGEIFPTKYYCINFIDSTNDCSVAISDDKTDASDKEYKNHNKYRSSVLDEMNSKCRLYHNFSVGKDMSHDELFGIATNMIQAETGRREFEKIQSMYPEIYDRERREKWTKDISYMKQQNYSPQSCHIFCSYSDSCKHGTNILSTVHHKRESMERLTNYEEQFFLLRRCRRIYIMPFAEHMSLMEVNFR